jgi:hypothetical protein
MSTLRYGRLDMPVIGLAKNDEEEACRWMSS